MSLFQAPHFGSIPSRDVQLAIAQLVLPRLSVEQQKLRSHLKQLSFRQHHSTRLKRCDALLNYANGDARLSARPKSTALAIAIRQVLN